MFPREYAPHCGTSLAKRMQVFCQSNSPARALVAAVIRKEQIIIPTGDTVIEPDDRIIIVARREVIAQVEKILAVKLEFF